MTVVDNVVTILGERVIPPGIPRPDLIKMVEDMLEQTRSGRVSGIAWAYVFDDGATSHNCGGKITRGLLGAIEEMKFLLLRETTNGDG